MFERTSGLGNVFHMNTTTPDGQFLRVLFYIFNSSILSEIFTALLTETIDL